MRDIILEGSRDLGIRVSTLSLFLSNRGVSNPQNPASPTVAIFSAKRGRCHAKSREIIVSPASKTPQPPKSLNLFLPPSRQLVPIPPARPHVRQPVAPRSGANDGGPASCAKRGRQFAQGGYLWDQVMVEAGGDLSKSLSIQIVWEFDAREPLA
jgi:hypothetical protein